MAVALGARDLVGAAHAAHRWSHAHPDVATYHRRYYELLREHLGIEFDLLSDDRDPYAGEQSVRGLRGLLRYTVRALGSAANPFQNYLQGPVPVHEAYRRHNDQIAAGAHAHRAALLDLAEDLLLRLVPELASRTTTWEVLRAAGLPDAVDPIDYW